MEIPSDCICLHLRRAARAASRAYDEALAPSGLRNTQFSLLCMLQGLGPIALSELADIAVMERTTLTRNLRPLEKLDLVSVEPGEDRRQRILALTKAGTAKIKSALPAWREAQAHISENLGKTRKKRLLSDLKFAALLSR